MTHTPLFFLCSWIRQGLAEIAEDLVRVVRADRPDQHTITLLAISVAHLVRAPLLQLELPLGLGDAARRTGSRQGRVRLTADHAIDRIRTRFGRESIGYGEVALEQRQTVPDAFRAWRRRNSSLAPHFRRGPAVFMREG